MPTYVACSKIITSTFYMNTLHGEKHAQHFSHCQVSHPLLINNDDDDDDDNKQTLTVRKPVQMGKTPIMKK